jgi:hypothetical protein
MTYIKLKRGTKLPSGHLLQHLIPAKRYLVVDLGIAGRAVVDELNKKIWISNTLFYKLMVRATP